MIPSRYWFPLGLQDRAAWYDNFSSNFGVVAASLGFTPAEVIEVENDNELMQYIAAKTVEIDAFVEAFRQYRINVTEGAVGSPTPAYPANPTGSGVGVIAAGVFERLVELVGRIRTAPAYTPEIGALLGIIPATPSRPPANELKPVIKATASFDGYRFSTNVTRLGQTGYKVQVQRQGQSTWADAAFAMTNPCEVTIVPTDPGDPERILVRAILLKNNNPVGEPSDPTYVTVNP